MPYRFSPALGPVLSALCLHFVQLDPELDIRRRIRLFVSGLLFDGGFVYTGKDLLRRHAEPEVVGKFFQFFRMVSQPYGSRLEFRNRHDRFPLAEELFGIRLLIGRKPFVERNVHRVRKEIAHISPESRLAVAVRIYEREILQRPDVPFAAPLHIQRSAVFFHDPLHFLSHVRAVMRQYPAQVILLLIRIKFCCGKEQFGLIGLQEFIRSFVGLLGRGEMVLLDEVVILEPEDGAQLTQVGVMVDLTRCVVQRIQAGIAVEDGLHVRQVRTAAVAEQMLADVARPARRGHVEFLPQLFVGCRLHEGIRIFVFREIQAAGILRHQTVDRGIVQEGLQGFFFRRLGAPFASGDRPGLGDTFVGCDHRLERQVEQEIRHRVRRRVVGEGFLNVETVHFFGQLRSVHALKDFLHETAQELVILGQAFCGQAEFRNLQHDLRLSGQFRSLRHVSGGGGLGVHDQIGDTGQLRLQTGGLLCRRLAGDIQRDTVDHFSLPFCVRRNRRVQTLLDHLGLQRIDQAAAGNELLAVEPAQVACAFHDIDIFGGRLRILQLFFQPAGFAQPHGHMILSGFFGIFNVSHMAAVRFRCRVPPRLQIILGI